MRFSPSSLIRIGGQSADGSSLDIIAGIQYCRRTLPIGVPGPVCVTRSLSDFVSTCLTSQTLRSVDKAPLLLEGRLCLIQPMGQGRVNAAQVCAVNVEVADGGPVQLEGICPAVRERVVHGAAFVTLCLEDQGAALLFVELGPRLGQGLVLLRVAT